MVDDGKFRESLHITLIRTVGIALVVGTTISRIRIGEFPDTPGMLVWAGHVLAVLWISLGGHWFENYYLNRLKPKLSIDNRWKMRYRIAVWLAGGAILFPMARITLSLIANSSFPDGESLVWAAVIGPFLFTAIEFTVHVVLNIVGLNSLFNEKG